jgi:hypothetical protein
MEDVAKRVVLALRKNKHSNKLNKTAKLSMLT